MSQFSFKGYGWAVGTTSFRTADFNVRIERQLDLIDRFWALPENANMSWSNNHPLQKRYYRFIQVDGFVDGNALRPDKDARQKTSGLSDIGLIDDERRLTDAGRALLKVARSGTSNRDNPLQIPADSLIYLKQLLKTSNTVDGNVVRPFAVMAHALLRLRYITDDEFAYLIPLCTTHENTKYIVGAIEDLRKGIGGIDEIILTRLMAMDNYQAARQYFLSEPVTESVITAVGMNRKSRKYDKPYYRFYELLRSLVIDRNSDRVFPLYEQSKKISKIPANFWRKYLFNTTAKRALERDGWETLNDVPLLKASSEDEFKRLFFEQMHLFKARHLLSDYHDLNRRYFKTTDVVVFTGGNWQFDVLPHCWLYSSADDLLNIAFTPADNLAANVDLHEIAPFLAINEQRLYANLKRLYGVTITTADDANRLIDDERYR